MLTLSLQRLLLSLAVIVAIGGGVVASTGAFFSDTETSTGNTFAAGDIDLKIDNTSYAIDCNIEDSQVCTGALVANPNNSWALADLVAGTHKFFEFVDIKPGDYGEDTISIHVGSNDAWMCAAARITADDDNSITEPEDEVGGPANSDGTADGDLDSELNFAFWVDDGDNVFETDESTFLTGPLSGLDEAGQIALAQPVASGPSAFGSNPIPGDSTVYIGKIWCAGTLAPTPVAEGAGVSPLTATGWTCNGASIGNIAQTDSVEGDMQFYAVQARNNPTFSCSEDYDPSWSEDTAVEINEDDLATTLGEVATSTWFFFDDTANSIMTIDQFAANNGQNHMESVAGAEGAKMVLHDGTGPANPRYNIATTQFGNTLLSTISSLKYRIYDDSPSAQTPFLNFNVDFFNTGAWQSRLVMVPTGVVTDTWTTVDAINGGAALWTYSGAFWPAGGFELGTTPGTTAKTWSSILADYPLAETNSGILSFLGVRVGHPGPLGETSFVDWIEFGGTKYDFEN